MPISMPVSTSFIQKFHHHFAGNHDSTKKLVFLHGLMGQGANWRSIARSFEKDFHILYYDQRGHGQSMFPVEGYAPEDCVGDLKTILDELGWESVYLVGHSMGGRVAALFTYLYPTRVTRLVIEDIGPDANPLAIQRIEYLMEGIPAPFADSVRAKAYFSGEFLTQFSQYANPKALGLFLLSNFMNTAKGEFDWRFDKQLMLRFIRQSRSKDRYDEFKGILVPTLLIRGQDSQELTAEVYARVLRENSRINGLEIAGAGHWVHYDRFREFTIAVQNFFTL